MFSYYIKVQLLLTVSSVIVILVSKLFSIRVVRVPIFFQLQLGYALVFLSLVSPLLFNQHSNHELGSRAVLAEATKSPTMVLPEMIETIEPQRWLTPFKIGIIKHGIALSLLMGLLFFMRDLYKLRLLLSTSYLFKRIGRVRMHVSSTETIPASFSFGAKSYVILPAVFLGSGIDTAHCVKHEIQHIRQRDTLWIYLLVLVEKLLFINPLVFNLTSRLKNLQELACDEELIVNKRVEPKAYATTLLNVLSLKPYCVGFRLAPSILGKNKKHELIGRITAMKNINNSKTKLRITFLMFLFCTAIIVFVANYSSGIRAPIQEIVPKEKISVYLDMESTLNGQRVMSPQIVTNMGKSSEFIAGEREGRSGTIITARPYQIEGMDSQEILIDFKVSKRSENSKKDRVILVKTVIARNREKSIILDERDAKTSEALRVLVTPYFGPPEVSSTNH